ncbi:MAG: hypothetical protein ACQSGP_09250 [Frankia sp.]
MSVTVLVKFVVDPAVFGALLSERAEEFAKISGDGKAQGCLHHQFVAGDDHVLAVDEWESADAFQKFFANQTEIPVLMQAGGVSTPPEVTVYQSLNSADSF